MGDYSRFLTKMAELKAIQGEYNQLSMDISGAVSTDTNYTDNTFDKYEYTPNKNPISNTKTPLVIRPGEDYADFWKYVGKIDPSANTVTDHQKINAQKCWNLAANDPRPFKKVVYTGNTGVNSGQPNWDNLCYGLVPDAPASASFDSNDSPGYAYMVGNGDGSAGKTNGIYTKLGISPSGASQMTTNSNLAKASKLYELQQRVDSLTRDIVAESDAGINNELNALVASASGSNELISKINDYMNQAVGDITSKNSLVNKRKDINSVYAEINEQTTLRARKYRFIFFIILALTIIIGYGSYSSKLTLMEQIQNIRNYIGWGWWTNWSIIAIVVIVFILSSFGWDMKGNILMVIRYVSDPAFWTGQLWWVGVTFLLLIMIFFYATFKSFFVEFDEGMKSIQSSLDGDST
jgi:hypothetical protein